MNLSGDAKEKNTFDAIVIGSGMTGGWAAKEFCERGLKTLVIERGRPVKHLEDYPTASMDPWEFRYRGSVTAKEHDDNPILSRCYAYEDATKHFFVKDEEHPYIQEKPFDWIRGYQEGGKSLVWARQTQRWSRFDFEAPARDGFAIPWPVTYDEIAPWYSHVEKFVGISGNRDGLETLPDSESLPPWEMNCVEKHIRDQIKVHYPDRYPVIGRCAHLTEPKDIHLQQGRGKCQARHLCDRGCPYGGYFSSNSSTLPWAAKTGNLTIRTDAVVHSILYDDQKQKAAGVRIIDAHTKEDTEFYARVIFVNAACLNSNLLLLNSRSSRFPNGLGNDNGLLGKFVAFHNYRGNISAEFEGQEDQYYKGRRPTAIMMPSFRNVHRQETDFLRGYMVFYTATRSGWNRSTNSLGTELKESAARPGPWSIFMMMQGETIPKATNHVYLSSDKKDAWGIPLLTTSIDYDDNDRKIVEDFHREGKAMLEIAGCKNVIVKDTGQAPGLDIHEMGGVRMGNDPKTSLLNKWNQFHNCKNVFVTDGAAMVSTGTQNPSLTFMAFTARAANHAVKEMKRQNL